MSKPCFQHVHRWLLLMCAAACSTGDKPGTPDAALETEGVDAAQPDGSPEDASMDTDAAAARSPLCSGCDSEVQDDDDMSVHLHHVHLNVSDRARSEAFYQEFFAAQPVMLNGASEALIVEPVLLLLDEVSEAPSSELPTALQHIGWGASDPLAWYQGAQQGGVMPDTRGFTAFNTDETPTVAGPGTLFTAALGVEPPACFPVPDEIAYIYVLGPDQERIELWSGSDDRVNHVHFTSPDTATALEWYQRFLGVDTGTAGAFFVDDILFYFEDVGEAESYAPTDEHVLGHVAFSVTDLEAWLERARDQNVEIVAEPARAHGFESFFVRGPDGMLIELVQASPFAGLCPDD